MRVILRVCLQWISRNAAEVHAILGDEYKAGVLIAAAQDCLIILNRKG